MKFSLVGYLMRFVNSVINDFESKEQDPIIPSHLFKDFESETIVFIDVPFCSKYDEKVLKQLLKKLNALAKEKYDFRIVWKTKKVR